MPITDPLDLANCKLWLDGGDATQMDSGGGLTYNWNDKSGEANHAVCQAHKPFTIHKSPLGLKRTLMIGGFAGGSAGGYVRIDGVATHLTGNCTIALVAGGQVTSGAGGVYLCGAGRSSSATPLLSILTASSKWVAQRRNDANTLRTLTSVANAVNTLSLHVLIYDGTNLTYRINGVQIGQGTASGAITLDQFALGVSPRNTIVNPGYALYRSVVVYSDAKSGTDLTDLESYLTTDGLDTLTGEITNTLPETFRPIHVRVTDSLSASNPSTAGIAHTDGDDYADFDDNAATGLYYVDYYNGNDGNSGVLASPLKTMDAALAKTDLLWIKNKSLVTPDGWGAGYTRPDRGCGISPSGVAKNWYCEAEIGTWTLTAAQTNTYEITRTGATTRVVDVTNQDAVTGEPQSLTSRASIALVESNPGSYFSDAGTSKVYVHAFDSRAISVASGIIVQIGSLDIRIPFTSVNRPWMLKSQGFVGRNQATQTWDIDHSRQFFYDVESHFGIEWTYTNPERVAYFQSRMTNGSSDLFDYRGDVIGSEVECVGDLTGPLDADNASTGHTSAVVLSVQSKYSRGSRNVHDIDATKRQMIDCDSDSAHNGAGGADTDVGYFCGANDGLADTCVMSLYKCRTDGGNVTDLIAENGCQIVCRGMKSSNFTQDARSPGTITFNDVPPGGNLSQRRLGHRPIGMKGVLIH